MARRLPKGWVRRLTSDGFEITPDTNSYHGLRLAKLRQIMMLQAERTVLSGSLRGDHCHSGAPTENPESLSARQVGAFARIWFLSWQAFDPVPLDPGSSPG